MSFVLLAKIFGVQKAAGAEDVADNVEKNVEKLA